MSPRRIARSVEGFHYSCAIGNRGIESNGQCDKYLHMAKSVGFILGSEKEEGVKNDSLGSFLGDEVTSNIAN